MRTYYVTVWCCDVIEIYYIELAETEKANIKTINEKLKLKDWQTIISWSLLEE